MKLINNYLDVTRLRHMWAEKENSPEYYLNSFVLPGVDLYAMNEKGCAG